MPYAQHAHRIEDVCYRGPWFISCVCGFRREWTADEVADMTFGGAPEEIEAAWLLHRRACGLTKK
jgi:hypothetical protein